MQTTTRAAGLAVLIFGIAGIAFFALALLPPSMGFEDTDDPALMLAFTRAHPKVFVQEGMSLLLMSISLAVAVIAVAEAIVGRANRVALRSISAFGLFASLAFFVAGALRVNSAGPVVHIADLNATWGEAAYVAAQVGAQALLITGIFMVGLWSVGLSVIAYRTRSLPEWLTILAVIPATRMILGTLAQLGLLPSLEIFWLMGMLAIPGTMIWTVVLGIVLLRQGFAPTDDRTHAGPIEVVADPA